MKIVLSGAPDAAICCRSAAVVHQHSGFHRQRFCSALYSLWLPDASYPVPTQPKMMEAKLRALHRCFPRIANLHCLRPPILHLSEPVSAKRRQNVCKLPLTRMSSSAPGAPQCCAAWSKHALPSLSISCWLNLHSYVYSHFARLRASALGARTHSSPSCRRSQGFSR
jgi:hypothetical protein